MRDLSQQLHNMSARLDALERENAELRARLDTDAPRTIERRFDRRKLLRLGGTVAAVGAGSVLLHPEVAGAAGAMNFGAENNAGPDTTGLASTNDTNTLHVVNSSATTGEAILGHNSNSGNGHPAVQGVHDGAGEGVVGEVTTSDGAAGVLGFGVDNGGVVGLTGGLGPAVLGFVDVGGQGAGVMAIMSDESNISPAVEAHTNGTGMGVYSEIHNPGNPRRAVAGNTAGTGNALFGGITNANSSAAAVFGGTPGKGPGVEGKSNGGVGGRFTGKTAQVQLVPSGATSHPASGSAGQLFVDKSKRLWFCRGGTSWKQLA